MFYLDDWGNGYEAIVQDRFVFFAGHREKSFTLFDSFNEDSRTIQTLFDNWGSRFVGIWTLVGDGRILLNVVENGGEHLLLLDFDFVRLECTGLDEVPINFACYRIMMDSVHDSHFMIYAYNNDLEFVCKGHLANDKIHIDVLRIEFGVRLVGYKLVGNKFFAFQEEQDNWPSYKFIEYDLSSNSARKVSECDFSRFGRLLNFSDDPAYIWENNETYSACFYGWGFSIVVFDADALKWTKTKFVGDGRVHAISIDEDQILTVTASEYFDGDRWDKTVYRFPMRKPDKLRYLAWGTIRRGSLFVGSDLYDKLFLPYNSEFRPVSENE